MRTTHLMDATHGKDVEFGDKQTDPDPPISNETDLSLPSMVRSAHPTWVFLRCFFTNVQNNVLNPS